MNQCCHINFIRFEVTFLGASLPSPLDYIRQKIKFTHLVMLVHAYRLCTEEHNQLAYYLCFGSIYNYELSSI